MTNTSKLPYRSDANATDLPSWLHTGANSYDSLSVSGIALPPAAGTDQMSPLYSKSKRLAVGRNRGIAQPQRRFLSGKDGYKRRHQKGGRNGRLHGRFHWLELDRRKGETRGQSYTPTMDRLSATLPVRSADCVARPSGR